MKILIANDDGIDSNGLFELATRFKELGEVLVVAPDRQMSATSNALTTTIPLRPKKIYKNNEFFGYAINGTPADCMKWALYSLLDEKPDIVLSGINHGRNTGINVMYSGTVAAAVEGFLLGIPSFAISLSSHDTEKETKTAAEYAFNIVKNILDKKLQDNLFLNINIPSIPSEEIKGIKVTKVASSFWDDEYEKRVDPFGRTYYWFNGSYVYDEMDTDTDDVAIDNGYIAITPLQYSFTNMEQMDKIKILEENEQTTNLEEFEENEDEATVNQSNLEESKNEETSVPMPEDNQNEDTSVPETKDNQTEEPITSNK